MDNSALVPAASPFMLNATLHHHLQQFESPTAVGMLTNLYVDNVISACNSHDQAIRYYQMAISIMSEANFNPLRTVVAYMRQGNKYFTVCKQIIITSPAFTL